MTKKKKTERPYTDSETTFIKQYYTQKTDAEIATVIGRDAKSVAGKMAEIGLKRTEKMVEKLRKKVSNIEVVDTEVIPPPEKETNL